MINIYICFKQNTKMFSALLQYDFDNQILVMTHHHFSSF